MRFGISLGPFWVGTSTRRRRRAGTSYRCASGHAHRTLAARQECEARGRRGAVEAAAAAEAKLEVSRANWREVARRMGPSCRSCGTEHRTSLEYVSGDPAYVGMTLSELVVRCKSCGTENRL